ncbi:crotonase/enoyl-CoA hydratase family protein [Aeromicrobium sp. 9AM]|uniref:crotonase/enoyl-CoA hydratase family protein n=1 Tax=Aeromicrobium sp. 9AM TaxID=2653126 RepID=UPI0012F2560A|nr:crotonase/enoyl-CoA hydratase family protein [Aeromicrobium sp. 9AM]VXB14610.1 Methylthioacryloyl-CoA hydratase [Aeromicrobium sp. 9AM]
MSSNFETPSQANPSVDLPDSVSLELINDIAVVRIARSHKRNALDDHTVLGLQSLFTNLPATAAAVVLTSAGEHFSAGLDLSDLTEKTPIESVAHSQMWHRAFAAIENSSVPVIAALRGAVIGGGLELASATHLRVAERSTFYALPEGSRGLFVGGGGSVRIPRLIGAHRMADMMLTGRVIDAQHGQDIGISHYLVDDGAGEAKALELARTVAQNSPITNFAILQALPRIAAAGTSEGYLLESLMAAVATSSPEAQVRMQAFLDGRAKRVTQA